ncbi:MAG: ATP-binding protein [Lachnospiraceae bacterium]
MVELTLEATLENLEKVLGFVEEQLEANGCSMKALMQVQIAVEEIYVNIVRYAYQKETGMATIRVCVGGDPVQATITFIDRGIPYDPLASEDPDTTLSAEERKIGGLGIFMVKKSMDDVKYAYSQGQNILTIQKSF